MNEHLFRDDESFFFHGLVEMKGASGELLRTICTENLYIKSLDTAKYLGVVLGLHCKSCKTLDDLLLMITDV